MDNSTIIEKDIKSLIKINTFREMVSTDISDGRWLSLILDNIDKSSRDAIFRVSDISTMIDSKEKLAEKLTSNAANKVGAVGLASGIANFISSTGSLGTTVSITAASLVLELAFVVKTQVDLICSISHIYSLHISSENPEPLLTILSLVYGIPLTLDDCNKIGKTAEQIYVSGKMAVSKISTKVITKAINKFGKDEFISILGKQIHKELFSKIAGQTVTAGIGSLINYKFMKRVGAIATDYCKWNGQTDDLSINLQKEASKFLYKLNDEEFSVDFTSRDRI